MKLINNPKPSEWPSLAKRPTLDREELKEKLGVIFADIENRGDTALIDYTQKFDGVDINGVILDRADVEQQAQKVPDELKQAIDQAYANIVAFHKPQVLDIQKECVETVPGIVCWRESRAIERVGFYIPGGSAPLISTVLMLGVPAQLAGCSEIFLCTPPDSDGSVNAAICYAALKIGVTKIVRVGGAQAIAAMAVGTESVPKVDKIFGPGNQYVTAAKMMAVDYGVAIDMPAGPSEVLVVADETAVPSFVAADLLSQAEHGPDSQVVLVATSEVLANTIKEEIARQCDLLPRIDIAKQALNNSLCIILDSTEQAIRLANVYAPEHLILSVKDAKTIAKRVINAGSVFLGNYSPESAGDYASGTNHSLPTDAWARSYGGVSVDSFVKKITFQSITQKGLQTLAPTIITLADAEGLEAHANAVKVRLAER